MSIREHPTTGPTKVGVAVVDVLTAKDAAIGPLEARARDLTGAGQQMEVNLLSSLLGSLAKDTSTFLATFEIPTTLAHAHSSIAPYQTRAAKHGQLVLCVGDDGQFARLAAELGEPDLAADPRFATKAERVQNRAEFDDELLEKQMRTDAVVAWAGRLNRLSTPAGDVGWIADALDLAERLGLKPSMSAVHPSRCATHHVLPHTPINKYGAPPTLRKHGDAVRHWLDDKRAR